MSFSTGAVPTLFPDLDESLQQETRRTCQPLVEVVATTPEPEKHQTSPMSGLSFEFINYAFYLKMQLLCTLYVLIKLN